MLRNTPIFEGFTKEQIDSAIEKLNGRRKHYSKEELIYMEGDFINEMGIVMEGSVRIEKIDYQGNRNIISNVEKGAIFGEAYALMTGHPLMIDVAAGKDCEILFLNLRNLMSEDVMACDWYPVCIMNLLKNANMKNMELTGRSLHTSSKHVRDRVMSYLTAISNHVQSREFDIPFNRQQMADYLGLDRSALSKGLCRMRDEGMIEFRKNHFRII